MAALQCEFCGGKLITKAGGICECDSCGMEFDKTWVKEKIQEIKGTVKVEGTVQVAGTVQVDRGLNLENQLQRGQLALEDKRWVEAEKFFDEVLNMDAQCALGYLGKVCAAFHAISTEWLMENCWAFGDNSDFVKALRFSSAEDAEKLRVGALAADERAQKRMKEILDLRAKYHTDKPLIAAGYRCSYGVKANGEVVATGRYEKLPSNVAAVGVGKYGYITKLYHDGEEYNNTKDYLSLNGNIALTQTGDVKLQFCSLMEKEEYEKIKNWTNKIGVAAGSEVSVALNADYTVVARGSNKYGECNVAEWTDIIAVGAGVYHVLGLKKNGNVVAVGKNEHGQCDVGDWKDIIDVRGGADHTVGLKLDGTVVAVGSNEYGQCDISGWKEIIAISAGHRHTLGLKKDGTVVATGIDTDNECQVSGWRLFQDIETLDAEVRQEKDAEDAKKCWEYNEQKKKLRPLRKKINSAKHLIGTGGNFTVGLKSDGTVVVAGDADNTLSNISKWKDIIAISAGKSHVVGLMENGAVVAEGDNQNNQCNVSDWVDIVAISAGDAHTVGLKSDGTVVAVGDNKEHQCNVSGWRNIIAISAGKAHTVGLESDGYVTAVGDYYGDRCDVFNWNDIVAISAGSFHTVGLKEDGTMVAVGENFSCQSDVSDWKDIISISAGALCTVGLKADGTAVVVGYLPNGMCNVSSWKEIVAISAGTSHNVGLKEDGTVMAAGINGNGQCNVQSWRLFQNINSLEQERKDARIARERRTAGFCQHCGGEMKGFLFKKCTICGKPKDY